MAMLWTDLKEKLHSEWVRTVERLEDNSTYVNLRDRFQSQSPVTQKIILGVVGLFIGYIILSTPLNMYSTSTESLEQFENQRNLLRDLFKIQKEIAITPNIPVPPEPLQLKSNIESQLQNSGLLPEQIRGINILPSRDSQIIKAAQSDGVLEVNLTQLNLRQVVDLGYQLQSLNPSVKMKDLVIQASQSDNHYFDVIFRLLVLKVSPEPTLTDTPKNQTGRK